MVETDYLDVVVGVLEWKAVVVTVPQEPLLCLECLVSKIPEMQTLQLQTALESPLWDAKDRLFRLPGMRLCREALADLPTSRQVAGWRGPHFPGS